MIEESGGLDHLEALQTHEQEKIFKKAYEIISEFFSDDHNEDAAVVPAKNQDQYEFTANDAAGHFNF